MNENNINHAQIRELKKCAKDPVYFINNYAFIINNYAFIINPIEGLSPLVLYDYQEDLINSYHKKSRNIVLSDRKSVV